MYLFFCYFYCPKRLRVLFFLRISHRIPVQPAAQARRLAVRRGGNRQQGRVKHKA